MTYRLRFRLTRCLVADLAHLILTQPEDTTFLSDRKLSG